MERLGSKKKLVAAGVATSLAVAAFLGLNAATSGRDRTDTPVAEPGTKNPLIGPEAPPTTTLSVIGTEDYCESYDFELFPEETNTLSNLHQPEEARDTYEINIGQFRNSGEVAIAIRYHDESNSRNVTKYLYPNLPSSQKTTIEENGGSASFEAREVSYGQYALSAEICGPLAIA